jgi:hypothetical protein
LGKNLKMIFPIVFASAASAAVFTRSCQSNGAAEVCLNKYDGQTKFIVINYKKEGTLLQGALSQVNAWYKINGVEGTNFNMAYWGNRAGYYGVTTGVDATNQPKFDIQVAFFAENKWDSNSGQNYRFQFE